jgi:hypothetical protein
VAIVKRDQTELITAVVLTAASCGSNGSNTLSSVTTLVGVNGSHPLLVLGLMIASVVGGYCFSGLIPIVLFGSWTLLKKRPACMPSGSLTSFWESHLSSPFPGEPPPDVVSGENVTLHTS